MLDQEREEQQWDWKHERLKLEARLQVLYERIKRENMGRRLWFWPKGDNGVMGFWGLGQVAIAGLNPGTGRGEDERDFLREGRKNPYAWLYRTLKEEELADAHVTDLIKIRGTDPAPILNDVSMMAQNREYFAEELRIVRPFVLVLLGAKTLSVLNRWWPVDHPDGQYIDAEDLGRSIEVIPTRHPAYIRRKPKETKARIRQDLQRAKDASARALCEILLGGRGLASPLS